MANPTYSLPLHDKINQLVIGNLQKSHEIGGGGVTVEEEIGIAHGFSLVVAGHRGYLKNVSGSLFIFRFVFRLCGAVLCGFVQIFKPG